MDRRQRLERELEVLITEDWPMMLGRLRKNLIGCRADDAEDILQQACVKALAGLDSFREESTLKTWFYRIMTNEFRMYLRRQSCRERWLVQPETNTPDSNEGSQTEDPVRGDSTKFVTRSNQYETVLLGEVRAHTLEVAAATPGDVGVHVGVAEMLLLGWHPKDIASELGSNERSVKTIIFRLRCTMFPRFTNHKRVRLDLTKKKSKVLRKGAGA